jgi:hypothetical protein
VSTLSLEKRRIEMARQKMLQQEYKLRAGELVDAENVDHEMRFLDQWLRERWLAFPARIAPKLAAKFGCDERKALEVIDRLVREQLDQLPVWRPIAEQIGVSRGARDIICDFRTPGGGRKPNAVKAPVRHRSRSPESRM